MLTLIKKTSGRKGLFQCSCGVTKEIRISSVKSGATKSCGCHRKKQAILNGKKAQTHGESKTGLYRLWADLKTKDKLDKCFDKYEDFRDWAKPNYKKGLIPHSSYKINKKSKFISSSEAKNLTREQTCLNKYGKSSVLETESVKEKIASTNLKKYGNKVASKSEIVKQKTIENNLKKYGVEYPQYTDEYRSKMSQLNTKETYKKKSRKEWADELEISRSGFNQRVQKHGFEIAVSMEKGQSEIESIIESILKKNNIEYIKQQKLDCYIPDFILPQNSSIIEADGLYWHSDAINKNKYYHKQKREKYLELGYNSLFFRENEILFKKDIVESIILNKIGKTKNVYFARKCKIEELKHKDKKVFFDKNHLMGVGRGKTYILSYKGKVVCALQYTIKKGLMDISRFCPVLNTSVVGGYSRLIKHVEKLETPEKTQSFIDLRYGSGEYLHNFGFVKDTNYLSFAWTKNLETVHRLKYRGSTGYDYGYSKIWDCGQLKYIKQNGV